ncbi:MAG: response regulator [Methylocystis sp.]|uniref:response regulator n=1 Tax=Methylocystis sp. TaxID=1911079 RepID=UPI003DA1E739
MGKPVPVLLSGARILVIEHNRDIADSFGLLLESRGAIVRVAYSGQAGLDALENFDPNLICVCLSMPGMDGYEVARQLRSTSYPQSAKLIAVTAFPLSVVEGPARAAGFDRVFMKPVTAEALKDLLDVMT